MSALRFELTTTATGRVGLVHGDEAIRQAIMLLLGTVPGERLMRPDYGSYLHRLLFAPNDQTTAGLAIHYVKQALQRWEPRIEIEEIDADPDPDVVSRLNIRLRYRVRQTLAVADLEYQISVGEPS